MFELIAIITGVAFTEHINHCSDCNEINSFISAEFDGPGPDWVKYGLTLYHNSQDKASVFGAVRFEGPIGTFVDLGVTTGYSYAPVIPFGRAGIGYRHNSGLGVTAFVFPSTINGEQIKAGVGVEISYRLEF